MQEVLQLHKGFFPHKGIAVFFVVFQQKSGIVEGVKVMGNGVNRDAVEGSQFFFGVKTGLIYDGFHDSQEPEFGAVFL